MTHFDFDACFAFLLTVVQFQSSTSLILVLHKVLMMGNGDEVYVRGQDP